MRLSPRLLAAVEESRAKVRIGYPWWLSPFVAKDVIAITLGRRIYVRAEMAGAAFERLMLHELVHVRQVQELGLLRFLWRYLIEFFRHLRRLRSVSAAYHSISFEIEAREAEESAAGTGL